MKTTHSFPHIRFTNGIYAKTTSHREQAYNSTRYRATRWESKRNGWGVHVLREREEKTRGYGFHETDISTYMVRSNVNSYSHKHHIPHHLQITTANYSYSKSLFIACDSQCFSLLFSLSHACFLLSLLVFLGALQEEKAE